LATGDWRLATGDWRQVLRATPAAAATRRVAVLATRPPPEPPSRSAPHPRPSGRGGSAALGSVPPDPPTPATPRRHAGRCRPAGDAAAADSRSPSAHHPRATP